MARRAEVLQKILNDADGATPIDGTRATYDPENYEKIMARRRVMSAIDEGASGDGYMHAQIGEGEVEFDERGRLKKIGRTQPKLIDPRSLTANRYKKETVKPGTAGLRPGTYLLVAFGAAIVRAMGDNQTLTPQVKVHRFYYSKKTGEWQYVRAELIKDTEAYLMTSQLDAPSALRLLHLIESSQIASSNVEGDSLDSILSKKEATVDASASEDVVAVKENVGDTGDSLNAIN